MYSEFTGKTAHSSKAEMMCRCLLRIRRSCLALSSMTADSASINLRVPSTENREKEMR